MEEVVVPILPTGLLGDSALTTTAGLRIPPAAAAFKADWNAGTLAILLAGSGAVASRKTASTPGLHFVNEDGDGAFGPYDRPVISS
jgi:hypothetical protein